MEDSRFDALTKALATPTSRRQALKTFTATALAGMLSLSGLDQVFARSCVPNGHKCSSKTPCCSGFCDLTTNTCACQPVRCAARPAVRLVASASTEPVASMLRPAAQLAAQEGARAAYLDCAALSARPVLMVHAVQIPRSAPTPLRAH